MSSPVSATALLLLSGAHHQAPVREYRGDAPVPEGGQGVARAHSALWHHLSGGASRPLRIGPNGSHVCRAARRAAQHPGKCFVCATLRFKYLLFRLTGLLGVSVLLFPQFGGAQRAATSCIHLARHAQHTTQPEPTVGTCFK